MNSNARIAVLPELVKNQIAAGEVVERPASVVKELVENALDAGATRIQVDLNDGGVSLVRVVDDGVGMEGVDLGLAFASHATSKLRDVQDLDHIATLGFRGEALASIGAVSRAKILSRRRGSPLAREVRCEGGEISAVREAGGPEGSTVEVRDLFFNTPARRRFLKSTSTELSRCLDVVQRLALANPGTGFVATHDGRRAFDVDAAMPLRERVQRTFGAELAQSLVAVEARDGTTRLSGFVAPPRLARHDTSRQMWFLNGRPLRDKLLSRVLKDAYRGFLVDGRQPVAFLALSIDPAAVDVNVHPAKSEVRFREERRLFGFLVNQLREAIQRTDMATPAQALFDRVERRAEFGRLPASEATTASFFVREHQPSSTPAPGAESFGLADRDRAPASFDAPVLHRSDASQALDSAPSTQVVLQIARTFLVRALDDGFEILDQHALHERIQFEALKRDLERGAIPAQRLLVPEVVDVSRAQVALVVEHAAALERLGLLVEPFGATSVAIHGLPSRLKRADPAGLLRDVLELIEERGVPPTSERVLEDVLHRAACRSSVMAGDELSQSEIAALLAQGGAIESDQTCVHGRPTRVRFTLADLEKAFHRR